MDKLYIQNLKHQDLRYLDVDYKDMDLIFKQITKKLGNEHQIFLDIESGSFGLLSLETILHIDGGEITPIFSYEIIGKNGVDDLYILARRNVIKKYWIYTKSWFREINRKILFTLMIWEFIDNQLGAKPQWKDMKIIKKLTGKM